MIAPAQTILTNFDLLPKELRYQVLIEIFRRHNITYEEVIAAAGVQDAPDSARLDGDLSPTGRELFRISMETEDDPDSLMTTDEIHAEIARRRGAARP